MPRRAFNANPSRGLSRCTMSITLRDKSGAQCMRRAVRNGMCAQHAKMVEDFKDNWGPGGMYGNAEKRSAVSPHTPMENE